MKVEGKICKSLFSMARGLMFSKKKTLIFVLNKEKRQDLHMFFVFFPIHVYYLDPFHKVIEIKEDFKPFKTYKAKKKAKFIVESPIKLKVEIGSVLNWE